MLLAAIEEPGLAAPDLAFRLYYLAAAYEDGGNPATAVEYYDRAASADPASPRAHRAKYWAARATETAGDNLAAAARYLDLAASGPAGEFSAEAAFRAGYGLLRGGDPAAAVAAWERLGRPGDARVLYWEGRARQALAENEAALAAFRAAAAAGPLTFYGSEALREANGGAKLDVRYRARNLARGPDWDVLARWLAGLAPGGPEPAPATIAPDLVAMGLRSQAGAVLVEAGDGAGPWRLLALVRQAYALGLADVAARLASRLETATGGAPGAPVDLDRVAYPIDYVKVLDDEGRRNDLDPLFLAALVRQESYWDPSAGSHAGALGLTQVIPSTGQSIANALGLEGFVADDLFRPALSLQFGAYYLGGQVKRFGDPYQALSAYNAGPANAVRWAKAAPGARPPDFVEAIDISETHDYVERVMDHYAHYLRAYGE